MFGEIYFFKKSKKFGYSFIKNDKLYKKTRKATDFKSLRLSCWNIDMQNVSQFYKDVKILSYSIVFITKINY